MVDSPLVLVPGLGCTSRLFDPQRLALQSQGEVIVLDHRADSSMHDIAQRFLDQAPRRFALAGLSMGGYVSFEIMRLAPERVTRLALLDTNAVADNDERRATRRALAARVAQEGLMTAAAALYPTYVHPARQEDHHLRQIYFDMMSETGADAFVRQLTAIAARQSALPILAMITVPTLVVVGAEDSATPLAQAEEIVQGIAGARLEVIPHCGHLCTLEKPQTLTRLLAEWWV